MKRLVSLTVILLILFGFSSCFTLTKEEPVPAAPEIVESEPEPEPEPEPIYAEITVTSALEKRYEFFDNPYAEDAMWLARPAAITKTVDVFYVFPPEYGSDAYEVIEGELDYLFDNEEEVPEEEIPVDGAEVVEEIDETEFLAEPIVEKETDPFRLKWPYYEAAHVSVFSEDCNVFAPYYTPENPIKYCDYSEKGREKLLRRDVVPDITEAFAYYMNNFNDGRPFILAGSSEGAAALLLMMKDLFANPAISNHLVAAYLPGTSVTERDMADYPFLKFVQSSDDTGVIISWNTEADRVTRDNPYVYEDTLVINPMTWSYTEEFVSNTKNKGAVFFDIEGEKVIEIRKFTSTQIYPERRVVVAFEPDAGYYEIWRAQRVPRGVYHIQDYTFFYHNIRLNVKERIEAYLDKIDQ